MSLEDKVSPRFWMDKLQAILHDLNEVYEAHLYWRRHHDTDKDYQPAEGAMNFVLASDVRDKADGPMIQFDLGNLSHELRTAIVNEQLRCTFVLFCRGWDGVNQVANMAIEALSVPPGKPEQGNGS